MWSYEFHLIRPRINFELLVQTTFGLLKSAPTSRALAFVVLDRSGARHTADRRIALVVKRVVGNVVLVDVAPHVALGPSGQGIDLDQTKLRVTFDDLRVCSCRGLFATNRGDPRSQAREHVFQRFDLALATTEIRIAFPKFFAVTQRLL